MVLSHPDDEIIFGYPYFQRDDVKLVLLICSNDNDGRIEVLESVCLERDVELHLVPSRSPFYTLPTMNGSLQKFYSTVGQKVAELEKGCDVVFTHNPHGEYGHFDHKLVFEIVYGSATKPVEYSDIWVENGWCIPPLNPLFYTECVGKSFLDKDLYERMKSLYREKGCWTWVEDMVSECRLFRLPGHPRKSGRYL